MRNNPKITIVTPSFNQGRFLENTILSVLEQDYENLEFIVMDGGSTDGSIDIIKKYSKFMTFWQSQPDGGQVNAINTGFQKATGEILTFLNSDDFLLKGAVKSIVENYHQFPDAAGWVGGGYSIAQDGYIIHARLPQKIGRDDLANWEENWFYQPSCFFSAKIAQAVGTFNPKYQNAFDFDFWIRLTSMGRLIPMTEILSAATIHPEAKTQKYRTRMFEEVQSIQIAYVYESFAKISQSFVDRSRKQSSISSVAKMLYITQVEKRKDPNRFVRFPEKPENI